MKTYLHEFARALLILFLSTFCYYVVSAQPRSKIENTNLKVENDKLIINYDIVNSKSKEKFNVWVEITTLSGEKISANSLSGDIGDNINGGTRKKIIWDIKNDNIYLDEEINVLVKAEIISLEEYSTVGRGEAFFLSTVFPGAGFTKIKKGKPHWLKGIAVYGCLAGSFVLNKQAVTNYDNYLVEKDIKKREALAVDWDQQHKISRALAITGFSIWGIDLIRTLSARITQSDNTTGLLNSSGFSIDYKYDHITKSPIVSLYYRF
ncbi:hypothetical protein ES705_44019 [subsurface metagenome]